MTMIVKASGDRVPFDANRLRHSLKRVGSDEFLIKEIINEVLSMLTEGMSTRKIYHIAFKLLRKKSKKIAAKYQLKRAIMQLGLSGFPFERFIAEIMRHQGFQTQNDQIITGYCVNHEVDIVAKRDNQIIFVECKYHNRLGLKCDVKISLYFKARFNDIEQAYKKNHEEILKGWLVTNTRFTLDAILFGRCAGLHLMSWDYPEKGSLKEQIEISGLYPITCITSFTKSEISRLLEDDIVLCKTISNDTSLLHKLNIPKRRQKSIVEQCHTLYKNL